MLCLRPFPRRLWQRLSAAIRRRPTVCIRKRAAWQTDSDADLIIYSDSYDVDTVIAKGQIMVAAGEALVKGTFEK